MNPTTKKIILQTLLFAALLFVANFILHWIYQSATSGLEIYGDEWKSIFSLVRDAEMLLGVGILFWAGFRISRQFATLNWWNIALSLLGVLILFYHIGYIYSIIDFYFIEGLSAPKNLTPMQELAAMMDGSFVSPPSYHPVDNLLTPFIHMCFNCVPATTFEQVLLGILDGAITKSIWIAIVIYIVYRKKRLHNRGSKTESKSTPEVG